MRDEKLKGRIYLAIQEFDVCDKNDYMLHEIMKIKPDIVGFSCFVWNIKMVLALADLIKKLRKNTVIVLGGPEASPAAQTILEKYPQIDIVVHDEGEITFLELVKAVGSALPDLKSINGISFRSEGKVVKNPPRAIIENVDSIPSPFDGSYIPSEDTDVCLETQRGCVYSCTFCFYSKGLNPGSRAFSLERVKKDLSFLLKLKLKSIYLMDPVFNLPPERAKDICRFIAEHNKNNIAFHTEVRAELIDEEMARLFKAANIKFVEVGLQSLDMKVLRSIKRGLNMDKFMRGMELLKKQDLIVELHLILGLPEETYESFMEALEFALTLETVNLAVFRLLLLPGTKIHQDASKLGIIYDEEPFYKFIQNKNFTFEQVIYLQKIINSLDLFRRSALISFLCREIGMKLLDMVQIWTEWLHDDRLILNNRDASLIKEKFKTFIAYLCIKHKIDIEFYNSLFLKEEKISVPIEREMKGLSDATTDEQRIPAHG